MSTKKEIIIGTQFIPRGKRQDVCTVTDILKTYNSKNELVRTEYISTHEFMGQIINRVDCAVTIQRGELEKKG